MQIEAERSCLLLIDVQQRLAPAMHRPQTVIDNCIILAKVAARLGVPIVASEQYPEGLGHTVPELACLLPADAIVRKMHFSCASEPEVKAKIRSLSRNQIIMAGLESHICVMQTALGFRDAGHECFVVADAAASRKVDNANIALERMRQNGIEIITTEMVVFEWLKRAGTEEFKELQKLIK